MEAIVRVPMPDGIRLACHPYRPENVRGVILLIPGFVLIGKDYVQFCTALSRMLGCVVYALDLRGQGESEGESGDIAHAGQLCEDIRAVLEELRARHGGLPTWLAAHSSGNSLMLRFLEHTGGGLQQGLIFISPSFPGKLELERRSTRMHRLRYRLRYRRPQPPVPAVAQYALQTFTYSPFKDLLARCLPVLGSLRVLSVSRPGVDSLSRFSSRYLRGYYCADPRRALAGISCPAWMLIGGLDEYAIPESIVGLFKWHTPPGFLRTAERIENVGHFSIFRVAPALIANWLRPALGRGVPANAETTPPATSG
ncbi:MAG: alpha/beta fold hydrolase [Azoarcus sp.]|jgi:pimeloyl-ACP methyl ester carboxylesterase|nr:alpha/beta fold hydrolase [Azoarcus sp.]